MPSALPIWVQWLQALGVPLLAAAGVFVAFQQWRTAALQARIAKAKAQHDTFDKKYEIYTAANNFLVDVVAYGTSSVDADRRFLLGTAHSRFFFPRELQEYLDRLYKAVVDYNATARLLKVQIEKGEVDNHLNDLGEKQVSWLQGQLNILPRIFDPFLHVDQFTDR